MSLGKAIYDKLIKKRNAYSLFLFSNGFSLLLGVLSSVDLNDLSQLKITSWGAMVVSFALVVAGLAVFVCYNIRARSFNT
jgi:hypothetical protein